jgi:hypothetical protein
MDAENFESATYGCNYFLSGSVDWNNYSRRRFTIVLLMSDFRQLPEVVILLLKSSRFHTIK